MKKGTLNFLGRKNQSLFDTNVKMKDMENMELVLGSAAIPESGTASVRARPTVKHYSSSSDSFHGFAVPTPTVPLFPPAVNGTKINGSVGDDHSSNGSTISVNDPIEGEIFVPPPPSMAPPPPPDVFILPPPEFLGDLNSPDLQRPPMPPPKPPSSFISLQEQDLNFANPPPVAPPKPPSTGTSAPVSSVPLANLTPTKVPERPKYAPPQPPTEKPQKTLKVPPPKPLRISSVPSFDSPPSTPAPPPPSHIPTLSTFNPQATPKLYSAQQTPAVSAYEDRDTRPKQILLLEDVGAGLAVPKEGKSPTKPDYKDVQNVKESVAGTVVTKNVKSPITAVSKDVQDLKESVAGPVVTKNVKSPITAVSKDVQDLKESVAGPVVPKDGEGTTKPVFKDVQDVKQSVPPPSPSPSYKPKPLTAAALKEIGKAPKTTPQGTPQLQRVNRTQDITVDKQGKPEGSSPLGGKYSPLLDGKLRNLKSNEPSGAKDASPLALLKAAKEREKQRSTLSQENSIKKRDPPSESSLSSLAPTSKSISCSSLNSLEEVQQSPKTQSSVATPKQPQVNSQVASPCLTPSRTVQASSPKPTSPGPDHHRLAQYEDNKPELNIPLLPPPPEFDDLDEIEPPPAMLPPDPPQKKAPTLSMTPVLPSPPKATPPPPPAPVPSPSDTITKSKPPPVQEKPKVTPIPPQPTPLSPNQATLLSILKKKMLEMDQKMAPVSEPESSSDDWGSPVSEEDNQVPIVPKVTPQKNTVVNKSATLDMRELENKVTRKSPGTSSTKLPTSNGPKSKHQYGMTFTVRPGTKQPITLVSKGEP